MTGTPPNRTYWNETAEAPAFPRLAGNVAVDVAIIGGGIVGITTARLLKDQGLTVAVIEGRRVGRQVTGKSTAKMSSQHGILYQNLEKKFGEERARLYAEAQEAGIRRIAELAARHRIEADIEPLPAFTFTNDESYVSQIEKEVEVARKLGLPASLHRGDIGLPYPVLAAIRFDGQAQFHPTKYVAGLAATIPGDGSYVFENSRAIDYTPTSVDTDAATVTARHVVMATHLPLGQVGHYYAMAYPKAEPVVAAPVPRAIAGMYKNAEKPGRSIRFHTHRGQVYAIAAGTDFKPGHADEEREHVADIERWLAEHFGAGPIEYRWINEDYIPMDESPFIGWSSATRDEAYLVATGFNAWGISNGTVAAEIIADLVAGRDNPWLPVFDATRVKPVAGGGEFLKENAGVAAHLVGGYLSSKPKDYDALEPGQAAILKVDGENVAAFRDEDGRIHAVSAVCTHMGCLVGWNHTDRTWDCPCHGSRFELSGDVIHGPATQPLGSKITG